MVKKIKICSVLINYEWNILNEEKKQKKGYYKLLLIKQIDGWLYGYISLSSHENHKKEKVILLWRWFINFETKRTTKVS